jgi:hypothetical protein
MTENRKIRLGLILSPERYILEKFMAATTPYLIRGIVKRFDCRLIASQQDYDRYYDEVEALLSFEPRFAAPVLKWRRGLLRSRTPKLSYVLCSDAHKDAWREDYILQNRITFLLGFYYAPFRRHFRRIGEEQLIHFPWIVPDDWITDEPLQSRSQERICCFGGADSPAYNVRNWCRQFPFVDSRANSGVENKVMEDREFFEWLKQFDAMVAAGSDDPKYDMTTPKYFEIAASGALLLGQKTGDMDRLGFVDGENCVLFDKSDFEMKSRAYLKDPDRYTPLRFKGRQLIRERHTLSVRLDFLENHIRSNL